MAYVQFNNYIEPDSTSNESSVTNEKISQETRYSEFLFVHLGNVELFCFRRMKKVSHKHLTAKSTKNYLNSCLDLLDNISNLVNKLKEEELSRIKKQKVTKPSRVEREMICCVIF